MQLSISRKIVLLGVLSCLAPVIVITWFAIHSATETSMATIGVQLQDNAEMVGHSIDVYFDQREDDAKVISQANVLESDDRMEQKGYFDDVIEANDSITDIMVVLPSGVVFSTAGEQSEVDNALKDIEPGLVELFNTSLKGGQGDVFFEKAHLADGELSMSMLTPITDDSNTKVISVLAIEINMTPVVEMISEFNEKVIGDEAVYLLNDDGEVIFTEDEHQKQFDKFNDLKVNPNVLDATDEDGSSAYMVYVNSRGIEVMAGMADMRAHGANDAMDWGIIALAETSAIAAPIYRLRDMIILIACVIVTIIIVIAILFSRTITRPLVAAADMGTEVSKGDLNIKKLDIHSSDEIGALSEAFSTALSTTRLSLM